MTKMKTTILIAAIISGIGLSASAHDRAPGNMARGPMGGDIPSFADLDADGNGSLSAEELAAPMGALFADADTNGDGVISAEELAAAMQQRRAQRMIERHDTNKDGVLSADEMPQPDASKRFERLDANDDGTISAEEFAAMAERAQPGQRRGHDRGHGHSRPTR